MTKVEIVMKQCLFVTTFFEYFDWKQSIPPSSRETVQAENDQVSRSLIGQQEVLGPSQPGRSRLLPTTRPPDCINGSGDINVITIPRTNTAASRTSNRSSSSTSATRQIAPNHTGTTTQNRRGKTHCHNEAFPTESPLLPPSQSSETG